jgi:hypothetical protein
MSKPESWLCAAARWWRLVAPPAFLWVALILTICVIEGFVFWIANLLGDWDEALRLHATRDAAVLFFAALNGVLRVVLHHPLFDARYREFLAVSPWERTKPLPLGPVRLALQDLLVLCVLAAVMAVENRLPVAMLGVTFLAAYLVTLAPVLSKTGQPLFAYAIWFGLALAIRLAWWNAWAAAAALVATAAASQYGLWRSWLRFPWTEELKKRRTILDYERKALREHAGQREDPTKFGSVWPYSSLGFAQPQRAVVLWEMWTCAALVGWWIYAIAGPLPFATADVHKSALTAFTAGSLVAALVRVLVYTMSHSPPLSFWGRIATGRLIIPGYDIVFVTPMFVALGGLPLYFGLWSIGVPPVTALAIATSLLLGLAFTGGPRLRAWQLTAPCRIVGVTNKDIQAN